MQTCTMLDATVISTDSVTIGFKAVTSNCQFIRSSLMCVHENATGPIRVDTKVRPWSTVPLRTRKSTPPRTADRGHEKVRMTESSKQRGSTPGGRSESALPGAGTGSSEVLQVEAFEPDRVRPWRFHNRRGSGMDEGSLAALARSIRRDGQQQLGLARRLEPGDTHLVEAIFGVRRLEACRRAGLMWRAEVHEASFSDAQCAALMHGENEWTSGISPLENALQWKAMLDAKVFKNQSALADDIGCHRARVSRAVRNATVLFSEDWLEGLIRPRMHEFSGRAADRLAEALSDPELRVVAEQRARRLDPMLTSPNQIYNVLCGSNVGENDRQTLFLRHKGGAASGPVTAKIEREADGGWFVRVRPHDQTAAELAELAEQVEALVAVETASAADVRFGRRLVALLSPKDAKDAPRSWLEGCVWTAARWSGLDWDRWRCAAAADVLRNQPKGWQNAVIRAARDAATGPSDGEGHDSPRR